MGVAAGDAITTGDYNVIMGYNAGSGTAAASDITAIGTGACNAVLTTAANGAVALGANALGALTQGERITGIGVGAHRYPCTCCPGRSVRHGCLAPQSDRLSTPGSCLLPGHC